MFARFRDALLRHAVTRLLGTRLTVDMATHLDVDTGSTDTEAIARALLMLDSVPGFQDDYRPGEDLSPAEHTEYLHDTARNVVIDAVADLLTLASYYPAIDPDEVIWKAQAKAAV